MAEKFSMPANALPTFSSSSSTFASFEFATGPTGA